MRAFLRVLAYSATGIVLALSACRKEERHQTSVYTICPISARDLEIEKQKAFIELLNKKISEMEKQPKEK